MLCHSASTIVSLDSKIAVFPASNENKAVQYFGQQSLPFHRQLHTKLITLKKDSNIQEHLEWISNKFRFDPETIFMQGNSYILVDVHKTVFSRIQLK